MKPHPGDGGFGDLIKKHGTPDQQALAVAKKPHKFNAIATEVDGHKFPSLAEAERYGQLKMMERAGEVRNLKLQPAFDLKVNGMAVCRYRGDFQYERLAGKRREIYMVGSETMPGPVTEDWQIVVEDVKGVRTSVYLLKKRLMLAIHGIQIVEPPRGR